MNQVQISSLSQAIDCQAEINRFLALNGIKDLVGDYGELLSHKALGGDRMNAVNRGFDIMHQDHGRIEVKTRKWELKKDGSTHKEERAVGFTGKEGQFDKLVHVILDVDFSVRYACMAIYSEVWPEILRTTNKVSFKVSSKLPNSIDITNEIKEAEKALRNGT
ncbi:hypothetical protein [Pseudoalteromonas sp. SiA1]|uniref:hypothetical protein n=1 Tax=Pseudoalteromonas sp. SiA1 TaxID=2839744 RepID=UPI001C000A6A|nr:hypothetical protein [Pseudoalteromonas sp. SiA1]QWF31283.1 hypothetical protein KK487_07715 [Pseudoalteromonas sp. SiA1]